MTTIKMTERHKMWLGRGFITIKMAAAKTGWSEDTLSRMAKPGGTLDYQQDGTTRFVSIASLELRLQEPPNKHDPCERRRVTHLNLDAERKLIPKKPADVWQIPEVQDGTGEERAMAFKRGYVSTHHAALITRRHLATVYRALSEGVLSPYRLGSTRVTYIKISDLLKWIGETTVRAYGL